MYEFGIFNQTLNEEDAIYGYNLDDAFRRNPSYNPNEWDVVYSEYID